MNPLFLFLCWWWWWWRWWWYWKWQAMNSTASWWFLAEDWRDSWRCISFIIVFWCIKIHDPLNTGSWGGPIPINPKFHAFFFFFRKIYFISSSFYYKAYIFQLSAPKYNVFVSWEQFWWASPKFFFQSFDYSLIYCLDFLCFLYCQRIRMLSFWFSMQCQYFRSLLSICKLNSLCSSFPASTCPSSAQGQVPWVHQRDWIDLSKYSEISWISTPEETCVPW